MVNKQKLLEIARKTLNEVELDYFETMYPQCGVLFLKGRPGTAKSALLASIAHKLNEALLPLGSGMELVDLRLPTKDETDLGTFPVITYKEVGEQRVPVLSHAVPEDFYNSIVNEDKYYLIVFEELNRADRPQRNASLGILNERIIGPCKLRENVFMAATGNIGQEDGTDVEEFDMALKGRLITIAHRMEGADGLEFWIRSFAEKNVHKDIVRYLKENPTHFYPELKKSGKNEENDVVVQPRTWTNLSKNLTELFGFDSTIDDYGHHLQKVGSRYVGTFAVKLHKFLMDTKRFTLTDVLKGRVKLVAGMNRDNISEVMNELQALEIEKIKPKEFERIVELVTHSITQMQDADLIVGMIYEWLVRCGSENIGPNMKTLVTTPEIRKILVKFQETEEKQSK